jgi:hypothetical protein
MLGLAAGWLRAWLTKRPYELPAIQRVELALLAFLPQAFTFFVPLTRRSVPQQWASAILLASMAMLVIFVWYNRRLPGFWLLGLGLLLNLAVIAANGGLMPISPETWTTVYGEQAEALVGSRPHGAKGVVLPVEETRLEWLADRYTIPEWLPIQFAYSLGDLFLTAGVIWTLWTGGAPRAQRVILDRQLNSSHNEKNKGR